MVQQIFSKKHASCPLSPSSLPPKIIKKNGIKYVLVSSHQVKKSKCLSIFKATGLTFLGFVGITFALKKFRIALFDNWRAVFTGERKVEKYKIAQSSASDVQTSPAKKSKLSVKKQKKTKHKKAQKISDKNTISIIYQGIPKSYSKFTIENLEAHRENVLKWMNDKDKQKDIYDNENPNTAIVDANSLKGSNIHLDRYELQVVLRYMVLIGDITAYESTRVGHKVAFNSEGVKDFTHQSGDLPITRPLLLTIDKEMKQFVRPTMPDDYSAEQAKMWDDALNDIQKELYARNLRPLNEENAVICTNSESKSLFPNFKRVFDDLVNSGTIIEWNATGGRYKATMKLGLTDNYDTTIDYLWEKWRDSTQIALD